MKILIITRRFFGWTGDLTSYEQAIDHQVHQVLYLANRDGIRGLGDASRRLGQVVPVHNLDDEAEVLRATEEIVRRQGTPDRVIALHEDDLTSAAQIRERWGIPGKRLAETLLVRDKVLMKAQVARAGVPVPRFYPATEAERAVSEIGFPLIYKPRRSSTSRGVRRIDNPSALARALAEGAHDEHEIEEFVDGPILHLDGIVYQGKLAVFQPFRYIGSCLAFAEGQPIGVAMSTDPGLRRKLSRFTELVLAALNLESGAFHLEVILRDQQPVFLEIGARVGGAFVPNTVYRVSGISLVDEVMKMELDPGYRPRRGRAEPGRVAGWLLFPDPPEVPVRVTRSISLRDEVPEIYREMVPAPGDVLDGRGGYIRTAGTFLLEAPTEADLDRAIASASSRYTIHWQRIEDPQVASA